MSRTKDCWRCCWRCAARCCAAADSAETETEELPVLVIGSDNYEPYFYLDENGAYAGIDVEIAKQPVSAWGGRRTSGRYPGRRRTSCLRTERVDCLWGSFSMNGRRTATAGQGRICTAVRWS